MSLVSSAPGSRRLLPAAWVALAAVAWAASFVVLLGLGYHLHRTGGGGPVDRALDARITGRLAEHRGLLSGLVLLGSPAVVVLGSLALAGVAAARRWRRAAALALLAAPLAGAATEFLLKPLIGVRMDPRAPYGFPSGHTTGAVALALVIVVLLLPRPGMHLGAGRGTGCARRPGAGPGCGHGGRGGRAGLSPDHRRRRRCGHGGARGPGAGGSCRPRGRPSLTAYRADSVGREDAEGPALAAREGPGSGSAPDSALAWGATRPSTRTANRR